ncbi:unnamed protein product [Dicrocoelium dendriticum]|nr:unnamed protein product [Dicrocoelium dendriticum]
MNNKTANLPRWHYVRPSAYPSFPNPSYLCPSIPPLACFISRSGGGGLIPSVKQDMQCSSAAGLLRGGGGGGWGGGGGVYLRGGAGS